MKDSVNLASGGTFTALAYSDNVMNGVLISGVNLTRAGYDIRDLTTNLWLVYYEGTDATGTSHLLSIYEDSILGRQERSLVFKLEKGKRLTLCPTGDASLRVSFVVTDVSSDRIAVASLKVSEVKLPETPSF
jgi:hypothetical protein